MDKRRINRADLLRCCGAGHDDEDLARLAPLFGFHPGPAPPPDHRNDQDKAGEASGFVATDGVLQPGRATGRTTTTRLDFPCVLQCRPLESDKGERVPDWLGKTPPLGPDDHRPGDLPGPEKIPLAPRARLWPFLRFALGGRRRGSRLDAGRAVKRLARGLPLGKLPRKKRATWSPRAQVLLDHDPRLRPFFDDFNQACRLIVDLRGRSGLEICCFDNGFEQPCRDWFDPYAAPRPYRPPEPGTPVLLLSDLGAYADTQCAAGAHARLHRLLSVAGARAIALLPAPPPSQPRSDSAFVWDRQVRLPSQAGRRQPARPAAKGDSFVERLLTLLSPAVYVEAALLRAMRLLLPGAGVATEAACWHHRAMATTPSAAFFLDNRVRSGHRQRFKNDDLRHRAAALIRQYHAQLHPAIVMEEELCLAGLLGVDDEARERHERMLQLARRMVKSIRPEDADPDLVDWVKRFAERADAGMYAGEELAAAVVMVHERELAADREFRLPPGLEPDRVAWARKKAGPPRPIQLRLRGGELVAEDLPPGPHPHPGPWEDRGSLLAQVTVRRPELLWKAGQGATAEAWRVKGIAQRRAILSPFRHPRFSLRSDREELVVAPLGRPSWASAMGRDQYGLWSEFMVEGKGGAVTQRLRWIPPGRFMMGSPPEEQERNDDERQHEVLIGQGFWLADTACAQELWEAVMGDNPSQFKGGRRPVENVSWDDCGAFLARLHRARPELAVRLPSEAEWEYACRAGTTTPFWFGDTISPGQVNYDGNYPYADGKKGVYRAETVAVDALPANGWGLFQMHGNVWEWVEDDWRADYTEAPTDGTAYVASPRGERRLMRGGSCYNNARRCRSASRASWPPDLRVCLQGFRLARGHVEPGPAGK